MEKPELIKRILESFPSQDPPAATQIVDGVSGEATSIKLMLSGKLWTDLKHDELRRENSALGFLTNAAFRYYIPAYMLLLLEDLRSADLLSSSLIRQLTLPIEVDTLLLMKFFARSGNLDRDLDIFLREALRNSTLRVGEFILRMKGITPQQGKTINDFLKYLTAHNSDYYDENEPEIARARYWLQFDT